MIFGKIWERYFLKQTLKIFFLFLFGFYALYMLLDYSSHSASFHRNHIRFSFYELTIYYGYEFISRMDVLLPFGLLLASIKTLCSLNTRHELVALLASGIKMKTLMRPFIFLGLLGTLLIYCNTQFFLPYALKQLRKTYEMKAHEKAKNKYKSGVKHLVLPDSSIFLYHHYDTATETFFDSYWILHVNAIYRIKYFSPQPIPKGKFVEYLTRDEKTNNLIVKNSFEELIFDQMPFSKKAWAETVTLAEELSLSELRQKVPEAQSISSEKEAVLLTTYYYKLAMPWLCLIAILAPAPFCVRFTRTLPIFLIYACSIFGLVAFYIIMNSEMVLGNRQVLSPFNAIWIPFSLFMLILGWRFFKL